MRIKHKHLIYAGTFDRLHTGHKKLLDKAFELAEKIAIGVTSNRMVKGKLLSSSIEDAQSRIANLKEYIKAKTDPKRAAFFNLDDVYGPSIEDNGFDSILVTEHTRKNADKINAIRLKKRLRPLNIVVEPMVRGDDGEVVTSERIRLGEIDSNGHSYQLPVPGNQAQELILPREMREELRKPLGKVIIGSVSQLSETAEKVKKLIKPIEPTLVVAVGDIITNSLIVGGYEPDIKIVDFRSRRKAVTVNSNSKNEKQERLINKAGTINIKTALEIRNSIKKFVVEQRKQLLIIEGEEDLLALPSILYAPPGAVVLYGLFDVGVVIVEVTEAKKKEIAGILSKFNSG